MNKALAAGGAVAVAACIALGLGAQGTAQANSDPSSPVTGLIQSVKTGTADLQAEALNQLIDASGVKGKVQSALNANVARIAQRTGLPESTVREGIAAFDIQDWQAVALPASAQTECTYPVSYDGVDATVTLYSDPSYLSVSTMGQQVTLKVPESAQPYVGYLGYLA
jgi:hypothetical protein